MIDYEDAKSGLPGDAAKLDLNNLPDLLTLREVADLLRVSKLTIKRWGKLGTLKSIRMNKRGDRRFRRDQVLDFIAKGEIDG